MRSPALKSDIVSRGWTPNTGPARKNPCAPPMRRESAAVDQDLRLAGVQAESEASGGPRPGRITPIEALENMRQLLPWNRHSVILEGELGQIPFVLCQIYLHPRTFGAISNCTLQLVGPHEPQVLAI